MSRLLILFVFICQWVLAEPQTNALYSSPNEQKNGVTVKTGPFPLSPTIDADEVRVKILRCQICQSDRRVIRGTKHSVLFEKDLVLGHEGVGVVESLPQGYTGDLKKGQLVAVLPHYVTPSDPYEAKGVPNLSPDMKHLGFHLNGVFADKMDFKEYSILPIDDAKRHYDGRESEYLDQMVKVEPLACVGRGIGLVEERMPSALPKKGKALVLGAGPMGLLNALYLKQKHPDMEVQLYDTDPVRKKLAQAIPSLSHSILTSPPPSNTYDLVITATSDRKGNEVDAPRTAKHRGTILLFSGIDMKPGDPRPIVEGVDIETVHRKEHVSKIESHGPEKKTVNLVGTSGYTKDDIRASIRELHKDLAQGSGIYRAVTTTAVPSLESHEARPLNENKGSLLEKPALQHYLETDAHDHLKILVRNSNLIETGELQELSEYLSRVQKILKEKYGIEKIYVGGGSARAILDHTRYGEPLKMRDLDVFAVNGKPVDKSLLEAINADYEKEGIGKLVPGELQPRGRVKNGKDYVSGHGFSMTHPKFSLDLSVYHWESDLELNGVTNIDRIMIPITSDESLLDKAHKISALNEADFAKSSLTRDPERGYATWRNKEAPKIVMWDELLSNPIVPILRLIRGFNKQGPKNLPEEERARLRKAIEMSNAIDTRRAIRNLLKTLGDPHAIHELRQLDGLGVIEKISPVLAKLIRGKSDSGLAKLFDGAVAVPGAKTSEEGLGRFRELALALSESDRESVVEKLATVEPETATSLSSKGEPNASFTNCFKKVANQ